MDALRLWTVGHSTLGVEELAGLLSSHRVELLVDVRRFPASRRHPHFNREPLAATLAARGIDYRWMPELGGRRKPRPDSRNTAWRNDAFRGYADYMETPEFAEAASALFALAAARRTAVMCAEALWWRCHRALIADYAKARGLRVLHIAGETAAEHPYTPAARVADGQLRYDTSDRLPFAGDEPL